MTAATWLRSCRLARWEVTRLASKVLRRTGLFAPVMGFLTCVAALAIWGNLERQETLTRAVRSTSMLGLQMRDAAPSPASPIAAKTSDFERRLVLRKDAAFTVQSVLDAAKRNDVSVMRADYSLQEDPDGGFGRLRMTVSVRGSSAAIQRFVQEVLASNTALALTGVHFERERVDAMQIDARLSLVLMVQSAPPRSAEAPRSGRTL